MHEYSVVQSLLESCEEHARQNDAKKVTKVVVKIGVLSGVEPDLLQTAFDTFKEQKKFSRSIYDNFNLGYLEKLSKEKAGIF